jgi:hypothetical protein
MRWRDDLLRKAERIGETHPEILPALSEFSGGCCRRAHGRNLYRGLVRIAHEDDSEGYLRLRDLTIPVSEHEHRAYTAVVGFPPIALKG